MENKTEIAKYLLLPCLFLSLHFFLFLFLFSFFVVKQKSFNQQIKTFELSTNDKTHGTHNDDK